MPPEVDNEEENQQSLTDILNEEVETMRGDDAPDDPERDPEEDVADKIIADAHAEETDDEPTDDDSDEAEESKPDQETKPEEPEEEPKPEGEDVQPDADADPDAELLAGMKERTKERFNQLRDDNKLLNERIETFAAGKNELHNVILESTATDQQLAGALGIFKAINSGNIQEAGRILPELQKLYDAVAMTAGQTPLKADPLEGFPDLAKGVEDLDITQERAQEIATLRRQQVVQQNVQQNQQRAVQSQTAMQQGRQQAQQQLGQWENHMLSNDPDYNVKQPLLLKQVAHIRDNYPPEQWMPRIQHEYETITATMAAQHKLMQKNAPAPMRAEGSGGSKHEVDTKNMSLEDLLGNAVAGMRG